MGHQLDNETIVAEAVIALCEAAEVDPDALEDLLVQEAKRENICLTDVLKKAAKRIQQLNL